MCDPVTLGIGMALSAGGALIGGNDKASAARREADARNAVLRQTLEKERGYATDNAGQLEGNIANYAPGKQDAQLTGAQGAREAVSVGNIHGADPNAVPITADAPPAVRGEIAKRLLAVHDGAVSRAKLSSKVGGFGDTWLKNNLNTAEADRNIGVTNNYATGQKDILTGMQDAGAAAAYKPPSALGPLMSGLGSIVGASAGRGGSGATPSLNSGVWGAANPGVNGSAFYGPVGPVGP